MKHSIVVIAFLFLLSGCHPPPPSLHHLEPTGDPLIDVILGGLLVGGIIAAEIADEKIEEHRMYNSGSVPCETNSDCKRGYCGRHDYCVVSQ